MDMMISYDCPELAGAMNRAVVASATPEDFRRMYARGFAVVRMLADWALNNGGSVVYTELCSGIVAAPSDRIDQDLVDLINKIEQVGGIKLYVGIGFDLKQSQTAMDWSIHTKANGPKYYDPQMVEDLSPQDEELDLNALVGSHEPMLSDDQTLFDQPFSKSETTTLRKDDAPMSDEEMDAQHEPPAKQEQSEGDDQQQPGAEDPGAIDPLGLLGEVTDQIKAQAQKIENFKQVDPDMYELFVDILRGIQGAVKALTPPELQDDGQGGDKASLGKGSSKDAGHGEVPVGTVHKGRVKVKLPGGGTSWVSAKSGQVAGGVSGAATKDYFGTKGQGGAPNADTDGTGDTL